MEGDVDIVCSKWRNQVPSMSYPGAESDNVPVSAVIRSVSEAGLKGRGSLRVNRKDCPLRTIRRCLLMSLVRWAELLASQWRSTLFTTRIQPAPT